MPRLDNYASSLNGTVYHWRYHQLIAVKLQATLLSGFRENKQGTGIGADTLVFIDVFAKIAVCPWI